MYLKPREGDLVRIGQGQHRQVGALGHLGDGQRERAQIYEPRRGTRSVSCATMRCAAFLAFSVVSPESSSTSSSLAPPSAFTPPCALMRSIAIWRPCA